MQTESIHGFNEQVLLWLPKCELQSFILINGYVEVSSTMLILFSIWRIHKGSQGIPGKWYSEWYFYYIYQAFFHIKIYVELVLVFMFLFKKKTGKNKIFDVENVLFSKKETWFRGNTFLISHQVKHGSLWFKIVYFQVGALLAFIFIFCLQALHSHFSSALIFP